VKQSIAGVLREGAIAAGLTALMIIIFLGSWRSTLVVMISIPLAILTSLVALYFLGETLNTMTLGGLSLAVGILVDDSTVTIENTHRLLAEDGRPLAAATLHGAAGIAVPTLVSTLAISCVFTSVIFLEGPAKYLFTPLGYAVVFAMLASYRVLNQRLRLAAKNTAALVDLLSCDASALRFRFGELGVNTAERLDHADLDWLFSAGMDRKRCGDLERGHANPAFNTVRRANGWLQVRFILGTINNRRAGIERNPQ